MSGRNYPEIEFEPQKSPDEGSLVERSLVGFLAFVEKFFTWDKWSKRHL